MILDQKNFFYKGFIWTIVNLNKVNIKSIIGMYLYNFDNYNNGNYERECLLLDVYTEGFRGKEPYVGNRIFWIKFQLFRAKIDCKINVNVKLLIESMKGTEIFVLFLQLFCFILCQIKFY